MANIKIVQTSNFGRSLGNSLSDVTFSLYDTAGSLYSSGSYSNIAVYEMPSSSGIYGTELTVNTLFSGSIVWKHNAGGTPVYASEEVKQMIFYADDGTTEIARYDLKDRNSDASIAEVFKRILVR